MTIKICEVNDLIPNSGICALLNNNGEDEQVAVFFLPETEQKIFAIGNWDPLGQANVLSRGIVGNIGDELVVASPLYKQHFSLITGSCLEEDDISVPVYSVSIEENAVILAA